MSRWHFTPGRVAMLCTWCFLLGASLTHVATQVERGEPVSWIAAGAAIITAAGSLLLWLSLSRVPHS